MSDILKEADAIAGQDRSRDYGHPYDNHRRIADIWNVQLEGTLSVPITPKDVALMMIGLKLARLINSPNHRDSVIDVCGYAKCWDMIDQHENAPTLAEMIAASTKEPAAADTTAGPNPEVATADVPGEVSDGLPINVLGQ